MTRSTIWIVVIVFVASTVVGASTRQRDLTGYDKAVADFLHDPSGVVNPALQEFVWLHWKQRRSGYVLVRSRTAEGKEIVNMIKRLYIEPSKDGTWCVHGDIESEVSPLRWLPTSQRKPPTRVTRHFEAISVERVGSDQHVVLKDRAGNVVDSLAKSDAYFVE
jgi:hypothetical protein